MHCLSPCPSSLLAFISFVQSRSSPSPELQYSFPLFFLCPRLPLPLFSYVVHSPSSLDAPNCCALNPCPSSTIVYVPFCLSVFLAVHSSTSLTTCWTVQHDSALHPLLGKQEAFGSLEHQAEKIDTRHPVSTDHAPSLHYHFILTHYVISWWASIVTQRALLVRIFVLMVRGWQRSIVRK